MNAPAPQYELVIHIVGEELHIYPETNDARIWIEQEAPRFGMLDDTIFPSYGYFNLRLKPSFDAREVARYLAHMGSADIGRAVVMERYHQAYPVPEMRWRWLTWLVRWLTQNSKDRK